ncbi:GntR family transcriptional regulator [Streptomyces marianii]|uniref:GntR family transcriptional regulator n=1 Tax=Streptomyces marianii TaxID=1817406 RepID=UPI0014869A28|nr:GntR family transcriptional regulator [Streptomyces marianii]
METDSRPPFQQAAEVLRTAIFSGELPPGARIPSARILQRDFGVSSSTVQNALRVLKREGLVYSVLGRGSYVREHPGESKGEGATDAREVQHRGGGTAAPARERLRGHGVIADDPRPPYVQVAEILRSEIQAGRLVPGGRFPSARELQERFRIANSTAQNATRRLKEEGLVYTVKGRGAFVRTTKAARPDRGNRLSPSAPTGTPARDDAELVLALTAAKQRLTQAFTEYEQALTSYRALIQQAQTRQLNISDQATTTDTGLQNREDPQWTPTNTTTHPDTVPAGG